MTVEFSLMSPWCARDNTGNTKGHLLPLEALGVPSGPSCTAICTTCRHHGKCNYFVPSDVSYTLPLVSCSRAKLIKKASLVFWTIADNVTASSTAVCHAIALAASHPLLNVGPQTYMCNDAYDCPQISSSAAWNLLGSNSLQSRPYCLLSQVHTTTDLSVDVLTIFP